MYINVCVGGCGWSVRQCVCVCALAKLWEILSLLFVVVLAVAVVFSGTLSASHYVYAALDTRHCINSSETLKQSGNAKTTSKYYLSFSVFAVFVFISAVSVFPHFPGFLRTSRPDSCRD